MGPAGPCQATAWAAERAPLPVFACNCLPLPGTGTMWAAWRVRASSGAAGGPLVRQAKLGCRSESWLVCSVSCVLQSLQTLPSSAAGIAGGTTLKAVQLHVPKLPGHRRGGAPAAVEMASPQVQHGKLLHTCRRLLLFYDYLCSVKWWQLLGSSTESSRPDAQALLRSLPRAMCKGAFEKLARTFLQATPGILAGSAATLLRFNVGRTVYVDV